MENIEIGKNIDRSYYLQSDEDFAKVNQTMNYMAMFQVGEVKEYTYSDTYFETEDLFLQNINATVRVRRMPEYQTLSIVCNHLGQKREFEIDMDYDSQIQDKMDYVLFLEDKIQDIYTHQLDVDVVRKIKSLKPFLVMTTHRKANQILTSTDFRAEVDLDRTKIETKRNVDYINVVEIKNKCYLSAQNEQLFEKFVKDLERKIVLIPMGEKKLAAGMRIFKREW